MVTFRAYRQGDIPFLIRRLGDDMGGKEFNGDDGPSWTIVIDGAPAAIFGFHYACEGVYYIWGMGSPHVKGHERFIIRRVREIIKDAFNILKAHRIQATCRTDLPEYTRTLELFGFQREGLLRKMGPKQQDLYIYSKVEP